VLPEEIRSEELRRLFRWVCEHQRRDADDVLAEMLEEYMAARDLDAARPAEPPACEHGEVPFDPSQPYACPKCRNAHELLAAQRTSRRLERMQAVVSAATDPGEGPAPRLRRRRGTGEPSLTLDAARAILRARGKTRTSP
jgi:hypothetical protein